MPHVHSIDGAARRRARAVALGFIGRSSSISSPLVAKKLVVVRKSMELHENHCKILGEEVHTAAVAAARVRHIIGPTKYAEARICHRAAGSAKHTGWLSCSEYDPLYLNDPWAPKSFSHVGTATVRDDRRQRVKADVSVTAFAASHATSVSPCPPQCGASPWVAAERLHRWADADEGNDVAPVAGDAGVLLGEAVPGVRAYSEAAVQTEPEALRADAHAFVPAMRDVTLVEAHWQALVDAQNHTIARLAQQIEGTVPGFRKMNLLERRLDDIKANVAQLGASLPAAAGSAADKAFAEKWDDMKNHVASAVSASKAEWKTGDERLRDLVEDVGRMLESRLEKLEVSVAPLGSSTADPPAPSKGAKVEVCGLIHNPKMNGLVGRCTTYFEKTSRWDVELPDRSVSIKTNNLRVLSVEPSSPAGEQCVRVGGIETLPCCGGPFSGASEYSGEESNGDIHVTSADIDWQP